MVNNIGIFYYIYNNSIYTGDTLFLGEVGRPDLAVKSDVT